MRFVETIPGVFINAAAICRISVVPDSSAARPPAKVGFFVTARLLDGETAIFGSLYATREEAEAGLGMLLKLLTGE